MTDILIAGGGPAGLTAAIYACRAGLSVNVLERMALGGQMLTASKVENYPTIKRTDGFQLSMDMEAHARELGAEIEYKEITGFDLSAPAVMCGDERLEARALILAMGAVRRKQGCKGEDKFEGRGVSYCATCDGMFFKGKPVAVFGGGDTALEDALYLAGLGCSVRLIYRRGEFNSSRALEERVRAEPAIVPVLQCMPLSINGSSTVESVTVRHLASGNTEDIAVSGVFVAVGVAPVTELLKDLLPLTESGRLDCGEDCRTQYKAVFCAGDIRKKSLYQIVTACSDGAVAATAAASYLRESL